MFEQIFTVAYLNVTSFTKHEKDATTEAYTKPSQIIYDGVFPQTTVSCFQP